jgi:hypothetical protein
VTLCGYAVTFAPRSGKIFCEQQCTHPKPVSGVRGPKHRFWAEWGMDRPEACLTEQTGQIPDTAKTSFAVALNCGIGSSSLNAEVNALDRLQIVR